MIYVVAYLVDRSCNCNLNHIKMGFSGAEAFRGTSAPSLKTEVSGEGGNEFFAIHFCYVLVMFLYDLFT